MPANACDTGRVGYPTKAKAVAARPDLPVKRCDRCRQWHAIDKRRRKR